MGTVKYKVVMNNSKTILVFFFFKQSEIKFCPMALHKNFTTLGVAGNAYTLLLMRLDL